MRNLRTEKRRRSLLHVLFLAVLVARPPVLGAQDDWAKRDVWQRPEEVMDALGLKPGSQVGDVGCGAGYFTFRLAARVGPQGRVYAVDIEEKELAKIRLRAAKEWLIQVEALLGDTHDPRLPAETLDAILIVNAYHEMRDFDPMMQAFYRALKPGGLLGIIDKVATLGQPRKNYHERHTMPAEIVHEDAARNGFHFLRNQSGFVNPDHEEFYFLIFDKPHHQAAR